MRTTHHRFSLLFKALVLACCGFFLPSFAFSNVYIAGTSTDLTMPFLWIVDSSDNIEQITLPGEGAAQCVALSVKNVYLAGGINNGQYASLWITNLDGSNPQLITLNNINSTGVFGITIQNSKVYMAAIGPSGAYLLITNLDGTNLQEITLATGSFTYAFGVAANASYVYVVGGSALSGNTSLWICNASDGSLITTVDLAQDEQASGVALAHNSVYISGNSFYFITDLNGSNIQTFSLPEGTSGALSAIAVNAQIYIPLESNDGGANIPPQLVIGNLAGDNFHIINLAQTVGGAFDTALNSSYVYTVGALGVYNNINQNAYLWITGLDGSHLQSLLLREQAYARSVAVPASASLNPLWSAFQLYNPVKTLRGFTP